MRDHRGKIIGVLITSAVCVIVAGCPTTDPNSSGQTQPTTDNKVTVPDLSGMEEYEAQTALWNVQLNDNPSWEHSLNVPEGDVISQSPAAGERVSRWTTVYITISYGPEEVYVPDVTGYSQSDAEDMLTEAGLVVGTVTTEHDDWVANGEVISQSPGAWDYVFEGSAVDLVVSLGPAPALHITNVRHSYSAPYVLDFMFSLVDSDGHKVIADPDEFSVEATEDDDPISPTETAFLLSEGDLKQLKCVLVLDYTNSMADVVSNGDRDGDGLSDAIEAMEEEAKDFVDGLHEDSELGLYEFHREDHEPERVEGLHPVGSAADKQHLKDRIDAIWGEYVQNFPASSRCWDAVYAGVQEFPSSSSDDERRFVIFLSDGRDESSTHSPSDIISAANSRDVAVYCIGFGAELDATALENITSSTGGEYYAARDIDELRERFRQILRDLGGQYVFRWTTLKRTSNTFTPAFTITHDGISGTHTGEGYTPTSHAGDPLHGFLRVSSDVYLRTSYMPRYITRIRLYVRSPYDFTPEPTGLCAGWTVTDMEQDVDGGWWFTIQTSHPDNRNTAITYGAFGSVVRFDFDNAPAGATNLFEAMAVDNTIYNTTGGQSLEISGWGQRDDGFESGSLDWMSWTTSGDAAWFVDGSDAYNGSYSARSGNIGHSQRSTLSVTVDDVTRVSFYYRVSSEWCCDHLQFQVDGQAWDQWSGETGWNYAAFDISSGTHTLSWVYRKDGSVNTGQDRAWIDDVMLE